MRVIRRLKQYLDKVYPFLGPFKVTFWVICIIGFFLAPFNRMAVTHFTKKLFDGVAEGNVQGVYFWSIVWIITAVVAIVLTVGLNYVQARFNIVINNQLKKRMIAHVLSAKKQHVEKYHTGDLISRINNDAPNAMGLLTNSLINITRQFILLIGMIIYLLWVNPFAVGVILIIWPMGLLISKVISPRIGQIQKEINEANAKINQDLQDRLKGIAIVKNYQLEQDVNEGLIGQRKFILNKDLQRTFVNFWLNLGSEGSTIIGQTLGFLVTGYLYSLGYLSLGSVMVLIIALQMVMGPLQVIPAIFASSEANIVSIDRIYEILEIPHEEQYNNEV
jgi:ABC-type multidrug transport system fused ATPase/permease subunit